ncbi:hypothetical protein [Oryza sativa Japonica Group]|uniref:Uncharacterized protein n=1 Tax=Oryza sativa subsp. japonica TaxID=39947 RepID=Q5VNY0_ORYSJ|nr:hypothetical protein OsJ_01881 [Oryza sativa Japonica Group]BAD68841.1 hypothetical protein [Oryza sativa Japonica Group]
MEDNNNDHHGYNEGKGGWNVARLVLKKKKINQMADNSGYPSKQMKVSLARRQAQNKSLQQQNEQLKLENEKLKKKNYAIKLQEFNSICSTCHMRAENACLGTEIQRLYARATNQETEAQPEEVDLPFPPTAGSQEGAPLNQDEPAPPSK